MPLVRAFALRVLFFTASWPQAGAGSITGTVTDATAAPIPGAEMTLINEESGHEFSTTTNHAGAIASRRCCRALTGWKRWWRGSTGSHVRA